MSQWASAKAKRVLAALLRIGWSIKRESSSHKILSRPDWPDVVFAFHDKEEASREWVVEIARASIVHQQRPRHEHRRRDGCEDERREQSAATQFAAE